MDPDLEQLHKTGKSCDLSVQFQSTFCSAHMNPERSSSCQQQQIVLYRRVPAATVNQQYADSESATHNTLFMALLFHFRHPPGRGVGALFFNCNVYSDLESTVGAEMDDAVVL